MAITQQLARISPEDLSRCRRDPAAVDRLCGFGFPPDQYLDLDWAPDGLEQWLVIGRAAAPALSALQRALTGDAKLNDAFNAGPGAPFEPIMFLEPGIVFEVSARLDSLDVASLVASLPLDATAARGKFERATRDVLIHPVEYLQPHLMSLQRFYRVAARASMATVQWWD